MAKAIRAALYLRVSTDGQSTDNQRQALRAEAERRGWNVTAEYEDAGISGAKGREKRPGLDRMLKDATRGKFDVAMCWAVDRLGRSLADLIGTLHELHGAKVDLFLLQQALDTTTPFGKAAFQMLGVFAEFERSMIQARVHAGLDRARKAGKVLGRRRDRKAEAKVREALQAGLSPWQCHTTLGVGVSMAQRVKAAMLQDGSLSSTAPAPTAPAPAPTAPA